MKLRGNQKLKRKLNSMSESVRADKLETAARAGAFLITNEAKRRAPYLTGNLRRSIGPETTQKTAKKATIAIGTNVEYAGIQEFGGTTSINGRTIQVPAQPYLRPALDEKKYEAEREIRNAWIQLIKGAI